MAEIPGESGRLIGRAPHRRELLEAAKRARAGEPQVVAVTGEAGVGKSALVRDVLGDLHGVRLLEFSGGPGVARVARSIGLALSDDGDAEHAIAELLHGALGGPTVVVVDCMELVDPASVSLLRRLASRLEVADGARLLVLLVGRRGDWVDVVAEAGGRGSSVQLGPLAEDEVLELLRAIGVDGADVGLVRAVIAAGGARPGHTIRLVERHGARVDDLLAGIDASTPVSVDSEVDPIVAVAAELDDVVDLDQLAEIAGADAESVETAVDAATASGLLVEDHPWPRFRDPEVRRSCAEMLGSRRRRRVHLRAAKRLDRLTGVSSSLQIGLHLLAAAPLIDDELADRHLRRAATAAADLGAWHDARRLLEIAASRSPDDLEVRVLEAEATYHDHDLPAAQRLLAEICESADADGAGWRERAAMLLLRSQLSHGGTPIGRHLAIDSLEHALDADSPLTGRDRSAIAELLAEVAFADGRNAEAVRLADLALDLAPDDAGRERARAHFARGLAALGELDVVEAGRSFRDCTTVAEEHQDRWTATWGVNRLPLVAALSGDVDAGLEAVAKARKTAVTTGDWSELSFADALAANLHLLAGRLDDVEEAAASAIAGLGRSEYAWSSTFVFLALTSSRLARGRIAAAEQVAEHARQIDPLVAVGCDALVGAARFASGDDVEPPRSLGGLAPSPGLIGLTVGGLDAAVGAEVGKARWDPAIGAALDALPAAVRCVPGVGVSVARLAATHAPPELRQRRLLDALDALEDLPLERARTELELAAEADRRGENDEAERWAERAGFALAALGADGLAARAAAQGLEGRQVARFILFVDAVDSTRMTAELGDGGWTAAFQRIEDDVRAAISVAGGVVFKHTGDGLAAWFVSATDAVLAAVDGQQRVQARPDTLVGPVRVRMGIAAGRPLAHDSDLRGLSIALAARVQDQAAANEVLITDEVRRALRAAASVDYDFVGSASLKGIPEAVELFRVNYEEPREVSET